jgi:Cu-Zn family superoxide dismutase
MKSHPVLPAALFASLLMAGCSMMPTLGPGAEAELQPTQGNTANGSARFMQHGDSVEIKVKMSGLTPGGHGFHVHEKGDCSAPDATSAGGHFNPDSKPHGHPQSGEHHVGDLPMLQADESGNATLTAMLPGRSLRGGSTSIVGKALIVHAAPDDYKTQPTGNSGGRVACGVIKAR